MSMNAVTKLKSQGIDAKQDAQPKVDVDDIWIPDDGPLAHPRRDLPWDDLDEALTLDIMEKGEVEQPVGVRRDGVVDGKLRLTLIWGSRRTRCLREAIRRWKEAGEFREERKYIRIRYFVGDDKAALLYRLKENTDPTRKPDSPSVLATTTLQLKRAKASDDEILAVMPRSVKTKADLENLLRWGDLTQEAAQKFDEGAPLALLGKVLDAPREKQAETVQTLVEAGATTSNKAARIMNKTAHENGQSKSRPLTPKQIRALTVAANKLGTDHGNYDTIDESYRAAMTDGFAWFGKLLTQEIKVDDLPEHLREMAQETLNKK